MTEGGQLCKFLHLVSYNFKSFSFLKLHKIYLHSPSGRILQIAYGKSLISVLFLCNIHQINFTNNDNVCLKMSKQYSKYKKPGSNRKISGVYFIQVSNPQKPVLTITTMWKCLIYIFVFIANLTKNWLVIHTNALWSI